MAKGVNETMKLVEDDASMNAIIAKVMELQNQESTDLPITVEGNGSRHHQYAERHPDGHSDQLKERLEALEEQRKELQARIAEERLAKPKMKEEFVRFWLLRFRQRQALDTFINAIYLYDDKVLITFNYKDYGNGRFRGSCESGEKFGYECARCTRY